MINNVQDYVRPELDTLADIAELWAKGCNAGRQSKLIRETLIKQCTAVIAVVDAGLIQHPPGDE
jgi:hypothetical protein